MYIYIYILNYIIYIINIFINHYKPPATVPPLAAMSARQYASTQHFSH